MSMYKGDNKSALTSQQLITDALITLLKSSSLSNISISKLCKEAQVSRQTFYTLFQSKENVIIHKLNDKHSLSFEKLTDKENVSLQDLCHCYSLYIRTNFDFLKLVIDNGLSQILFESFYYSLLSCKRTISERFGADREYIASFAAGGFVSIATNYIKKGPAGSSESIESLTYSLFSGSFFYH